MMRAAAALLVVCAVLASAGAAHAHASLMRSEPADRAVVAQPPVSLKLIFNEPVSPLVLRLVRPGGEIGTLTGRAGSNGTLAVPLPQYLADGTHLLSWRVVSADGHPVGGSLTFSIGAPSAAPASPQSADAPLLTLIWLARLVLYAGLFAGVGGVFFVTWFAPDERLSRAAVRYTLYTGLVVAVLSVGLHGADVLGLALTDIRQPAVWRSGLSSIYGHTLCLAALALALALVAAKTGGIVARVLSALALAGVGMALAASGHAASAEPQTVTRPAVFLHGVCVAFWLGALMPLAFALAGSGGRSALLRFSRAIPVPLVVLIATGAVLAVIQVRQVQALWSTNYGIVLSCKLAAVAVLLGLAFFNRRITPRVLMNDGLAKRRLRVSIAAELVIMAAILGLVASWRFTPPPRALIAAAAAAEPVYVHIHTERVMAEAFIERTDNGSRRIRVVLRDGELRPFVAREVAVVLSKPDAGIEPMVLTAERQEDVSGWRVAPVSLPLAGRWHMRIVILVSDFDEAATEDDVELPP